MDSPVKRTARGKFRSGFCFLKVLVQYALRGYANSWNMESCEMLDTLNEVKHFVDLSVTADSDLIRYQATNQILLKMWKYFRNLLEELKQECKEPEENEEEPPQEEEPSEAEMSQEEPSEKEPAEVDEPPEERRRKNHRRKNRQKKNQQGKKILQRKIEKRHPREMENPWEKRKKNPPQKKRNPKGKKNL